MKYQTIIAICRHLTLLSALALAQLSWGESAPSALEVRGNFVQGGIVFGTLKAGESVWLGQRRLRLSDGDEFVFGLDRDAAEQVTLTIVDDKGRKQQVHYPVKQREYKVQRIEGVAQKHVTPPDEVLSRIASEAARVRQARTANDDRQDFLEPFVWPLQGPITGVYGSQRVYNGVPKSPHYGIDIAAPVGTVVQAPAAGVVTFADDDLYYSGGTLIVDHGHGLSSTFIHLHKILVEVGQGVTQGQAIAEVGATGRVTGPHLDWRMNWFDVRVDPQLLMQSSAAKNN